MEPSHKLAPGSLSWRCAECVKGLPAMSNASLRANAKAHLATCCPGVTMIQNRWRAAKKFEDDRAAMVKTVATMRAKRSAGTKDEKFQQRLGGELGNEVVPVILYQRDPKETTGGCWKGLCRSNNRAFACRQCWRIYHLGALRVASKCMGKTERLSVMRTPGRIRLWKLLRTDRRHEKHLTDFVSKVGITPEAATATDEWSRAVLGKEAKKMYKINWAAASHRPQTTP